MLVPIPQFTAPSYGIRRLNGLQNCINLFTEKGAGVAQLMSTPGLYLVGTVTNNEACRGAIPVTYVGQHRAYSVHNNKVYRLYYDGTKTEVGTIGVGSGRVSMAYNGLQICITDGLAGYIVTLSTDTTAAISDINFPVKPGLVTHQAGRFIVNDLNTDNFHLSAINAGQTWTPLLYSSADESPGHVQGVISNGTHVYLVKNDSTEIWYNTGNAAFTFERINGASFQVGTTDRNTIASLNGAIFFIGSSNAGRGSVWMINGTTPTRISTAAIEAELSAWQYGEPFGFCYEAEGHQFYQLTNKTTPSTYVYDVTEGAWHTKISSSLGYHRAAIILNAFMSAAATPYAFDTENGKVYSLGENTLAIVRKNTEDGTDIVRQRVFGPIASNSKRVFHYQIRIEAEVRFDAAGTTSISATLDWTDDAGLTYSTAITLTKTVTSSATSQRVVWIANRLGSSAERYYRLTLTGPAAKIILKKCELDLQEGRF